MDGGNARFRLVASAVLVAAGTALLVGCATQDSTSGRGPQSTSPVPASVIASAAILAPSDFSGSGWHVRNATTAAPPGWRWDLRQCVLYDPADYLAQQHRTAVRQESYAQGTGHEISVVVESFAAGWGARSLEDTRAVLDTCGSYEFTDAKNDFRESHAVAAESFAGDESLLVEGVRIAPPAPTRVQYTAVVRRGDLVVTVTGTGVAPDEVRHLASIAADRLV